MLYGTRYTDLCYGYNAFRRECLDVMRLNATEIEGCEPGQCSGETDSRWRR